MVCECHQHNRAHVNYASVQLVLNSLIAVHSDHITSEIINMSIQHSTKPLHEIK
jgi:hypothetical protein